MSYMHSEWEMYVGEQVDIIILPSPDLDGALCRAKIDNSDNPVIQVAVEVADFVVHDIYDTLNLIHLVVDPSFDSLHDQLVFVMLQTLRLGQRCKGRRRTMYCPRWILGNGRSSGGR